MSLLLACIGMLAIGLPDGAVGVAWPSLRATFSLPLPALGLLLGAGSIGTFCAGILGGGLIERTGFSRVLPVAAALSALGMLGQAVAPDSVLLCLAAFCVGVGNGGLDVALNASAAMRFSARAVNWMHGCYGVGATLSPLAMTAVIVSAGASWRGGYGLIAAVIAAIACAFARAHFNDRALQRALHRADPARPPAHAAPRGGFAAAARHRLVHVQIVLFFVYTGLEVILGQWAFSVLTLARGVEPGLAGTWTACYWASLAGGRFAFGGIVGRVGADRLLRWCTVATLIGALAFTVLPGAFGVLGLMLAGAALAPIFPTMMARAPARLGDAVALHAVGFQISAAVAGAAALPALGGWLAQRFGLDAIGWLAVASAVALVALHEVVLAMARRDAAAVAVGGL